MDNRISLQDLPLPGLALIKRNPIGDSRGFLQRMYCQEILSGFGLSESIAQINLTLTQACGSVRGMHFQRAPYAETKIVTCLRGRVFDVAVDLRENSPTFLQWHGEILSPELCNSLLIPKGFAHGFQTLSGDCELLYFHTAPYHQPSEGGLSPMDPMLKISWPLAITQMSDRDRNHPLLTAEFKGLMNEM
ncbi:dTDP-4-dehydrorhamnose 3,5-epimerase family protein [Aquicella lusitana]|nr:dTDP-4-dehydrorhamnose 3,5-epimerase family protein [Aquicella lusitana]VVC72832.1 dTDP-4-dehydrorhamnose 3,5-epimerase [Aquicella lusitana]